MRVLHVVAHLSPDRRYGGPSSVVMTQARALARRGVDVVVAAGSDGYGEGSVEIDGVSTRLFPSRALVQGSWAYRVAPGMLRWVKSVEHQFDIVHVHVARDLTTLPVAASLSSHMVLQPHGMIEKSEGALKRGIDMIMTRKAFARADAVIGLNEQERFSLHSQFATENLYVLPNAVDDPSADEPNRRQATTKPQVLFLARLHARKRPMTFVAAAIDILDRRDDVEFLLVGPDDGEGSAIQSAIAAYGDASLRWIGAVSAAEVPTRMGSAAVYVLPAADEPFGLTLLEAVSAGTPVVADQSSPLGRELVAEGFGALFDGSAAGLADAIETVLGDSTMRTTVASSGAKAVRARWGADSMAQTLHDIYSGCA